MHQLHYTSVAALSPLHRSHLPLADKIQPIWHSMADHPGSRLTDARRHHPDPSDINRTFQSSQARCTPFIHTWQESQLDSQNHTSRCYFFSLS